MVLEYYADFEFDLFNKSISSSFKSITRELKRKEKQLDKEHKAFEEYCRENSIETNSEDYMLAYEMGSDLPELSFDALNLRGKLSAIGEMRIVYLYKSLEINLKGMIQALFGNEKYQWTDAGEITVFKKYLIDTKGLEGYPQINLLRKVNNAIKHNDDLHHVLRTKFPEFVNTHSFMDYEDFDTFYHTTLPYCSKFLQDVKIKLELWLLNPS